MHHRKAQRELSGGDRVPGGEMPASELHHPHLHRPYPSDSMFKTVCISGPIFSILVGFRLINAFVCTTFFVPDEYWQSLEVAHRMVFGYGYLTWEWQKAIRGYTHPLIFALLYKLLAVLHLDWPMALVVLPRVLQALLAAVGDYYVLRLTTVIFGPRIGTHALLCNVLSWFTFYSITRTLSNSTEAALTAPVLYYWTRACRAEDGAELNRCTRVYLSLAAVSFLVRPTGVVLWLPLLTLQLVSRREDAVAILKQTILVGLLSLCWSLLVDWYFYGKLVVAQLNFLLFNVFEGHSALYGTHPWHWYFSQGVPVVLFTSLPLVLLGVWQSSSFNRVLFWLSLWLVVVHSFLGHKEFRFIHSIVPISSVYVGLCVTNLLHDRSHKALHYAVYGLLVANIPMGLYFSLVHQRGTTAVMDFLRKDVSSNSSVLFLMPCHSSPYYSHIHQGVPMRFLECPPPVDPGYEDVARAFYSSPELWLQSNYPSEPSLPTHLVMFNSLQEEISEFLSSKDYQQVTHVFHTHFPEDRRFGTHVLVFRRDSAMLAS